MGEWSLVGRYGAMARIAVFALSIVGAALAEVVSSGAQAPLPSSTVELAITPPDGSNQQATTPVAAPDQIVTAAIPPPETPRQPLDSVGPARAQAAATPSDSAATTPSDATSPNSAAAPANEGDQKPADSAAPASSQEATPAAAPEQPPADPIVAAIREMLKEPALRKSATSDELAALEAFYAERSGAPLWITPMGFSTRAQAVINEIQDADDWGLASEAFDLPPVADLPATSEAQAADEIKLDVAVLKYARFARGGRMTPSRVSDIIDQKASLRSPKTVLTEIADAAAPDAYLRSLQPKQEQFERLQQALVKLRASSKARGRKPPSDPVVQRIVINMERWRWMPSELGSYYVWDNIPAFTARVMKNGKSIYVEKTVVGQVKYATPVFSAQMRSIAFNPEWIVPETIKLEDLQPSLRGGGVFGEPDTSILREHQLSVSYQGKPVDASTVDWGRANILQYTFTQPPGPENVLGKLKFNFPNRHAIYMHDTIQPEFFDEEVRALSHGCIRVRQPDRLAALLLAEDKGWSAAQVQNLLATGNNSIVPLSRSVPVHLTYFTVVADEKGKLQAFDDIYGIDAKMSAVLFGRALKPEDRTVEAMAVDGAPKKRAAWNNGRGGLSDAINGLFGD